MLYFYLSEPKSSSCVLQRDGYKGYGSFGDGVDEDQTNHVSKVITSSTV